MAAEGKTSAMLEWAKQWPDLDGYLKLNAFVTEDGEASISPVQNDAVLERYIDGTAVREYTFQLRIMTLWSPGFDPVNEAAEAFAASWQDWVSEQYALGNVPDFGGAKVTDIQPVYNVPALNFVYQDDGLAEYLIQAVVTYEE